MPSAIKEQDKIAWCWMENTDPKNISKENIASAYRIKQNVCKTKTCRRNCRGNPYCLSGLGESRLTDLLKNPSVDDLNITLARRAPGSFVGLTNLGATCYVNSLLQLWFHNKVFRDAILSWDPSEDPVEQNNISKNSDDWFVPETFIGHLQQLFALMCHSERSCIDPSPLIESLRLDTSTQQDAQEFSKLFISILEEALTHQSLPTVHNLISNNFRGEYSYVTRCCKCLTESVRQSMFYELELNVKGHNTLHECLSEFLQEEKLDGPNRYSCTVCDQKQEACRFIKLQSLPPVLNLQLLRFVYDKEKGQKKKLKTLIQFPETLDMTQFVEAKSSSSESLVYNLSAVLIHKGSQAYSGHFVAYIKYAANGAWYTFNDEAVIKSEGKRLKLDEQDETENVKKTKLPKLLKGFQSSTDAYMLVYTSENHNPGNLTEVQLSKRLQMFVESQNNNFNKLREEVIASKEQSLNKYVNILNTFSLLPVENVADLNNIEVISIEWLTAWLSCKDDNLQKINNTKLICSHGYLDPNAVPRAKYISHESADILYDQYCGGPRLKLSEALCEACVTNQCVVYRNKAKISEESKEVNNILKKRMGVNEPGFYVDKYFLKTWRTKVLSLIEGSNSSSRNGVDSSNEEISDQITEDDSLPTSQSSSDYKLNANISNDAANCIKKEVIPKVEEHMKPDIPRRCINKYKSSWQRRKQNHPTITVPLRDIRDCFVLCQRLEGSLCSTEALTNSESCSLANQCKQLKIRLRRLSIPTKTVKVSTNPRKCIVENKKNGNTAITQRDDNSIKQCCSNGNSLEAEENIEKTGENDELNSNIDSNKAFNEAIVCCHGNLSIEEQDRKLVPVRVWEILKQYFPSAPCFPRDTEPCQQCRKLASKDNVVKMQYYECALNQKKMFSDLFNLRNRPQIGSVNDLIYVIPKQLFHQNWTAFIKSATRKDIGNIVDPPASLNVDTLICVHGLLHYNLKYDEDLNRLVLVSKEEWEGLSNLYVADQAVSVSPDYTTQPELCLYCFSVRLEHEKKEKLNYDRARIIIRLVPSTSTLDDQDSSEAPMTKRARIDDGSYDDSPDFVPADLKKDARSMEAPQDVRRSSRTRRARGQKDVHLTVSSTVTLRELKQMITNRIAVAPFDQHLIVAGQELEGDTCTLAELGILPNTMLLLQVDEAKESFDMLECSRSTEPEAGFKGTGLLQAY